jgi:hypothetical protein
MSNASNGIADWRRMRVSSAQCCRHPRSSVAGADPIAVPRRWACQGGAAEHWSCREWLTTCACCRPLPIGHLHTCPANPSQCQSVVASVIRPPRFQVQPRPLPSCPLREINKMPANCQLPMDPDPRPLSRGLTWARRLADSGFLPPSRCPPARSTVPIPGTAPSSCFFDEVALRLHPSSIPIVTCTSMHH